MNLMLNSFGELHQSFMRHLSFYMFTISFMTEITLHLTCPSQRMAKGKRGGMSQVVVAVP